MERRASPPVELCPTLNVSSESSRVRPPFQKIDSLRIVLQAPYQVAPASRRLYADISHAVMAQQTCRQDAGATPTYGQHVC
jgi:hypothetical protein